MTKPMESGAVEIVTDARRTLDERKELVVWLRKGREGLMTLLDPVLPPGGIRYVVPKGRFEHAIDFEGEVLELRLDETADQVRLYPRFRVVGMATGLTADDAGGLLAAALHGHLQRQIPRLREKLHVIFKGFIGLNTSASTLDDIVHHQSDCADDIRSLVKSKLGIEIEWLLEPEPDIAKWIQRLQMLVAQETLQTFNPESRTAQFNLAFTARIISVRPSCLHLVQRRVRAGLTPENERDEILKRTRARLNPAFGIFDDGLQIWHAPNFWPLVRAAFNEAVAPTIAEEFGYEMTFQDFRRERTLAERDVLEVTEARERLTRDFLEADRFYADLKAEHRKAIRDNDFNSDSDYVRRIGDEAERAREGMQQAKARMEAASRGTATALGPEDKERALQRLTAFHDRLGLRHRELLKLEAGDDSTENPTKD